MADDVPQIKKQITAHKTRPLPNIPKPEKNLQKINEVFDYNRYSTEGKSTAEQCLSEMTESRCSKGLAMMEELRNSTELVQG